MNRHLPIAALAAALMLALTACSGPPKLDTPQLRSEAVGAALDDVAAALESGDAEAIRQLTCAEPHIIEPLSDDVAGMASAPLSIEADEPEPLDLSDSTYEDPDPEADFHIAGMRQVTDGPDAPMVTLPEIVIRVDDELACVWAMGPPFALLMGL